MHLNSQFLDRRLVAARAQRNTKRKFPAHPGQMDRCASLSSVSDAPEPENILGAKSEQQRE